MLTLVLFDMDGVIFEGSNFWLDLHSAMGTEKQAWQLWEGLGAVNYARLASLTANNLWKHKSADKFRELVSTRRPTPHVEQVFAYLNDAKIKSAIVSSGPYQLAQKAQRLFGVAEIRANKLDIGEDGRFTGGLDVQVDDNHKDIPAIEVMHSFGANYETTAMIGDTVSDVSVARLVSLPIAYDTADEALAEICRHRLSAGNIAKAVDFLQTKHAEE